MNNDLLGNSLRLRDSLKNSLDDSLWRSSLKTSLVDSLKNSLDDSLWRSLYTSLYGSLSLWGLLWDSLKKLKDISYEQ